MLKCIKKETLQAYLDNELNAQELLAVESHLAVCTKCSSLLTRAKSDNELVNNALRPYSEYFGNASSQRTAAWHRPEKRDHEIKQKGVLHFMQRYKKYAAAACIGVALTACISVQPIRAAISDALSLFRVNNLEGIDITLADLENIRMQLEKGDRNIDLKNAGSISTSGGEQKISSMGEIKNISDLDIALPEALHEQQTSVVTYEPASVELKLNVKALNRLLKSISSEALLPESIDMKPVTARIPRIVSLQYGLGSSRVNIMQTRAPEIEVPAGVNTDELYNSILKLPLLPDNIKKQLLSVKDWRNTLYLPVVENVTEEIDLNGVKGYYYSSPSNSKLSGRQSMLIFKRGDTICGIQSDAVREEIIKIARSMR